MITVQLADKRLRFLIAVILAAVVLWMALWATGGREDIVMYLLVGFLFGVTVVNYSHVDR